ncbi:MAG: YfbK domain-containing protein, partial [Planctomycetota bacterium]
PVGVEGEHEPGEVPDLKYQDKTVKQEAEQSGELGTVKFRYKKPSGQDSIQMEEAIKGQVREEPSGNFEWSAAVAMFGMELRDDEYRGATDYELIKEIAQRGRREKSSDYREECLQLVDRAETLKKAEH